MRAMTMALAVAAACLPATALAQHRAHVHGFVALNVVFRADGSACSCKRRWTACWASSTARAPKRSATPISAMLALIGRPQAWLQPGAAAQCTQSRVEVQAATLQAAAAESTARAKPGSDAHADLEASVDFQCAAPERLAALELKLFEPFGRINRINRIDVQVVSAQGQHKQTLRRGRGSSSGSGTVRLQR
ncbi:MAG: DUF2796 domain-containing protein [Rubrivivax sp.]|nr:DUF2796 domain-containing protein [Rubrivivax sp.]